jgi:phage head maturation protease
MHKWLENLKSNPKHAAAMASGEVRCKANTLEVTKIDRAQRLVWAYITSPRVDLEREVILPEGIERDHFPETIKTLYIDHDYNRYPMGVGVCRTLLYEAPTRRLLAQSHITTRAIGDELLTAIDEGAVGGTSVGVLDIDAGRPTADEVAEHGEHDCIVRRSKLIEYSFTSMPCNLDALVDLTRKGKIRRETAVSFGLPDTPERKYFDTGTPRVIVIDPAPLKVIQWED